MAGPPEVKAADLARACDVKSPSVSAWLTGKTKNLEGANLLAAAELLRVNPWWLATGRGQMRASYVLDLDRNLPHDAGSEASSKRTELEELYDALTPSQQLELLERLRLQVADNDRLQEELLSRRLRAVPKPHVPESKIGSAFDSPPAKQKNEVGKRGK